MSTETTYHHKYNSDKYNMGLHANGYKSLEADKYPVANLKHTERNTTLEAVETDKDINDIEDENAFKNGSQKY
jgi:hypothetical protein